MLHSTEKLVMDLEERSEGLAVLEAALLILMNVASIAGNILVCLAVHRNNRLHTIPNMFVVALAISDLLVATISMPFSSLILAAGKWLFDEEYKFCIFMGFCLFQCGISSLQMLCQIAVNRYFCVVKPTLYRTIYTRRKAKYIIALSWILGLSVSIPPLVMQPGRYTFQPGKAMCLVPFESNRAFTVSLIVIFIATPMNIIAFSYYNVYKTVNTSNQKFKVGRQASKHNSSQPTSNVEEAKVTKTLAAVVAAFAFCWLPIGVIDIIDAVRGETTLPRQVYLMYAFLAYFSSTVNPFIYGIFSRTFRREYRKLLCGQWNTVSSTNESMTYHGNSAVHTTKTDLGIQNRSAKEHGDEIRTSHK